MTKKMRKTFIAAFTTLALGTGMLACGALNSVSASATDGTPVSDFRMAGATIKLFEIKENQDDNSAIRFRIQMSDSKYETVYAENSAYTVGALLLPADCTAETTLTKETVVTTQGASIYDQAIVAADWIDSEDEGYMETYVDLYNFPKGDYNRVILATGYIYDGTDYTYTYEYAADGETKENVTLDRSMAQVANLAINDTSADAPSDDDKALAANYILSYAVNYVDAETGDTIATSSAKYGETVTVPEHTENAEITGAYVDQAKETAFESGVLTGTTTIYTTGTYFTGEGTKDSPYVMDTAEEVFLFAKQINENGYTYEGKYLKTTKSIDLGVDSVWTPIEAGFKGTFDGRSKTISNVNINATEETTGFFRFLNGATIKNLKLSVNVVNTAKIAGGLVGTVSGTATIDTCTVSGSVKGASTVGGIVAYVGKDGSLTIKNCENHANVTSSGIDTKYVYLGGVLGSTQGKVVMSNCINRGTLEQQVAGQFVGGVAGLLRAKTGASITGCYNYGNIIVPASATWVAGVVGCNRIEMTDCYCLNTATITVGTTEYTAGDQENVKISGATSTEVYYLAGTNTSATIEGGLCDADGNAITE